MDSSFQILKAGWKVTKKTNLFESGFEANPYLIVNRLNDSNIEVLSLDSDKDICYYNSNEKYCVGYENSKGKWLNCPSQTKIDGSHIQCELCSELDFFSCRGSCRGLRCLPKSPEAKVICDRKETYLYLTFVANKFKVGVSLNPIRRWVEQGSLFSILLYQGYGLETRFKEQTIASALGLKLGIKNSEKIDFIGSGYPSRTKMKMEFANKVEEIRRLNLFELHDEPIIYSLAKYYNKILDVKQKPVLDNLLIKGRILGVIGKLLVLQHKNSIYVTNLKRLYGHVLTEEKPTNSSVYSKQRSIYDYRN